MKVFDNVADIRKYVKDFRKDGKVIGFVPTMGALHPGHLSLVQEARKEADLVITSIFVNPTQFAPGEDYDKYPRDFNKDQNLLIEAGADAVFYPTPDVVYGNNYSTYVDVEGITQVLEGSTRPTHFKGVTTVVSILFNIVKPDVAVFGRKDAQQAAVLCKMVKDLQIDIKMIVAPIIREKDGIAMSSRNVYLSEQERTEAKVLSESLIYAEEQIKNGARDTELMIRKIAEDINAKETSILDYVTVVDAYTFERVAELQSGNKYYLLLASKFGKTRLIDNLYFSV